MLKLLSNLLNRVCGVNKKVVSILLLTRRQLLVKYYRLIGIKPNKNLLTILDETALDIFCYSLIDYLFISHFCVYEKIFSEMQNYVPRITSINNIYCLIENNTKDLMQLYDNYLQKPINENNYTSFQRSLSKTGELLESRFTLEDQLIKLVLNKYFSCHHKVNYKSKTISP
ncbi:Rsd/AlgQ family anti-sigma factor [Pantoea sp. Aalb]|uniref:Rsd/AlgQ family anti-sigma factor n=1 Tax=Pantoea sp. Aalb TaxID=2576762 RepID=UPI0013290E65|nr:Rsd/AlgQ family anti-sigma factor [Pantoea sp. Aalb]MXP67968.1 sigma D regulator [Pantoea sp. Aalb]